MKKILVPIILTILLISLSVAVKDTSAQVSTITIYSDGSVGPASGGVERDGNIYTLTGDLYFTTIEIQKNDIILDGANHTLHGPGVPIHTDPPDDLKDYAAISLMASNVTITNFHIANWTAGIYGAYNNNTITANEFSDNARAIALYATDYTISKNIIQQSGSGIYIKTGALTPTGDNNRIINNHIVNNAWAFNIISGNGTTITQNNVTNNDVILFISRLSQTWAGYHLIYMNNFIDNTQVLDFHIDQPGVSGVVTLSPVGQWDNGTFGNYWSDYLTKYPNASESDNLGIGNTPYLFESSAIPWSRGTPDGTFTEGITIFGQSIDHYPLMQVCDISTETETETFSPLTVPPSGTSELPDNLPTGYMATAVLVCILAGIVLIAAIYRIKRRPSQ
ncbi:MAG: hypothetical protein LBI79_08295 [Nitrososphaerota archaeon]|jgi:hypothetical protein|nr:hypothetical protein [Nitrososphaerota archaeon]